MTVQKEKIDEALVGSPLAHKFLDPVVFSYFKHLNGIYLEILLEMNRLVVPNNTL